MYCIIVENYGFLLDFQNEITFVQNQLLTATVKVSESTLNVDSETLTVSVNIQFWKKLFWFEIW